MKRLGCFPRRLLDRAGLQPDGCGGRPPVRQTVPVESVEVWRGAFGDTEPPFGPLPGVRAANVVAYEFALSDRFRPWPGQTLLERAFILTDVGVGLSFPPWHLMVPTDGRHQRMLDLDEFADAIEAGDLPVGVAIDGLRRWQRFLDTYVHHDRDPRAAWTNFPPAQISELAALAAPLGPVVTSP